MARDNIVLLYVIFISNLMTNFLCDRDMENGDEKRRVFSQGTIFGFKTLVCVIS